MATAGNITAVLTLNSSGFQEGLNSSITAIEKFKSSFSGNITPLSKDVESLQSALRLLSNTLDGSTRAINNFSVNAKSLSQFKTYSESVNKLANALKILSSSTIDAEKSMNMINSMFKYFQNTLNGTEVKIKGVSTALRELKGIEDQESNSTQRSNTVENERINTLRRLQKELNIVALGIEKFNAVDSTSDSVKRLQSQIKLMESEFESARTELLNFANTGVEAFNRLGRSVSSVIPKTNTLKLSNTFTNPFDSGDKLAKANALIQQNSRVMRENGAEVLRNMGYRGKLSMEEEKQTMSTNKNTQIAQRNTTALNQQTTATRGLGNALSSLKMMGSMVASMMVWNFAHSLITATRETVNAKSEMEGYFKMLHFGQGQINNFNKALDETVKKFPRLNKYALGETISSIGVEFELTTKEMEKAMPVVSMITSEYLRAGRNVNEASLAVKDILQGEFQRLSRETGVKGEQLKEAGWSGDKNDVMGLLDALKTVGESRNWDTFVLKANSLNDAVLILQNRFSEWSADMVNVVQPTILSVFNSLMSVAEGFATGMTGIWEFLNSGTWESTATNIGLLGGALGVVSQALVMYRAEVGLVEATQLGLKNSIASLIFGLKAESIAHTGVKNAILGKILGLKAESIAENGVTNAIRKKILSVQQEEVSQKIANVQEQLSTAVKEENALATQLETLQNDLNIASKKELITTTEADTIQERINTLSKELNAGASLKQAVANEGLVATLYMLGTGEAIVTGETSALTIAWGVLNGVFALSPIGWITAGILALAGAFYVLTGGLDPAFEKMKKFNEILKNPQDTINPYREKLEQVEKKFGETSKEAENARDSLENVNSAVQHGAYWNSQYQESFEGIDASLDDISRKKLGDLGYSKEQIDQVSELHDIMYEGANKDYKALQVLHKQQENYGKGLEELDAKTKNMNLTDAERNDILEKYTGNMANLQKHSAIANTSEDWWEKSWNQLYAGMDQFWIDWDNFWLDVTKQFQTGDVFGLLFGENSQIEKEFRGFGEWLSNGWKYISDGFKFHLDNVWKDMVDPLVQGITVDLPKYISDSLGRWGEIFDGIKQPFMEAWNGFWSFDWINLDSTGEKTFDIGSMLKNILHLADGVDTTWAFDFVYNNIALPLLTGLNQLFTDPISMIGEMGFSITSFLDSLFPTDFTSIYSWVYNKFVKPIGDGLWNGIQQIPIVGDIISLFGLVTDENVSASNKGRMIAHWIGNGINSAIGEIPIVGDILRMLGVIPSTEPNARDKGHGVGQSIKQGVQNGYTGLTDSIRTEMSNVISVISKKAGETYAVAHDIGSKILKGIQDALDMHSPSIISRELIANEFGVYIPQAITDNSDIAYNSAYSYAEKIKEGISNAGTTTIGMDTMVDDYETDAQTIALSSKMMGNDTTSAFNQMQMSVNATTNQMQTNVVGTYSQIQSKQASSLTTMKNQNISAYNDMYLKSNQSMIQMRDSTTNVTHQMTNAWNLMKNNIVASAQKIKTDSEIRFNSLSTTIGGFYRKIQNPSQWGGGAGHGTSTRVARKPSVGKALVRGVKSRGGYAGGLNTKPNNATMTISQLKRQLCPSGDCGNLFDGYNMNDTVNVWDFLQSIGGEHGLGGWNFAQSHYNYIKNKSDAWDTAPPIIDLVGGIPTSKGFKVSEFNDGTPKISFSTFEQIATSIFSTIPYKFYFDSSWKGSWLGALQSGACNCYDGALALIALANTFGFSGSMAHGTWTDPSGKKTAHVWAVINGVKMDTTGMQQRGTWRPSSSAGGNPYASQDNKTVNITVDMSNATVYGVEDLDSKIQESVSKGLQAEFNDPYTITI